jgi:N-dimethylarginine dimethylaminohydrolase
MGDALWHPGRRLLWGGYGFRTELAVYEHLSETLAVPVLPLALHDPEFYHLDTCLCPLDEQTALVYPGAFTAEGLETVRAHFERVIEAPEDEARTRFACNAHSPDGQTVLIQRGCTVTNARLREAGYEVVELETDEFLKSGGSVFCMKVMYW